MHVAQYTEYQLHQNSSTLKSSLVMKLHSEEEPKFKGCPLLFQDSLSLTEEI
jgi:hypothetical protein